MNREAVTLWADALASGEFPRIPYPMHTSKGFDALGVLVEVYRRKFGGEWIPALCWCKDLEVGHFKEHMEYNRCAWLPPDEVLRWLDLQCECPNSFHELGNCESAMFIRILSENRPFPEVAGMIRSALPASPSPGAS